MEKFNFLSPKTSRDESAVLGKYYDARILKHKFIVRAPLDGSKYYVFPNIAAYIAYAASTPESGRCFHEVICGLAQRKFRVDIDAKEYTGTRESFEVILDVIKESIRSAFAIRGGFDLTDKDFILTDSSNRKKISHHIIVDNYCFENNREVEKMFKMVSICLDSKQIDTPGCSFITQTDNCKLVEKFDSDDEEQVYGDEELNTEESKQLLELANKYVDGYFQPRSTVGRRIDLDRIKPGHCTICDRFHEHDGAYLIANPNKNAVFGCYRKQDLDNGSKQKAIKLGKLDERLDRERLTKEEREERRQNKNGITRLENLIESACVDHTPLQVMNSRIYSTPTMSEFEVDKEVLLVWAAMKMGKTKELKKLIQRLFPKDASDPARIIALSFRVAFASSLSGTLKDEGFVSYADSRGVLNQNRFVVQVESLHRVPITGKRPGLLILDECESIFGQFDSTYLGANRAKIWSVFEYLIKYSERIICMDAHLSERTINVIKSIRPDAGFFLHRNTFANATTDICNITTDIGLFMELIRADLATGFKLVIPTNSRKAAKAIEKMIDDEFEDKVVGMFCQDTSAEKKKIECADVNLHWRKYDIIIYTPTISAGISFEEKHFDRVYVIFTDQSCSAEDCMQMLMRVRNLSSKTVSICFNCVGNNLPTTLEGIKEHIEKSDQNLINTPFENMPRSYDIEGNMKFHESSCFLLHLQNQCVANKSKNNFISIILGYFKAIGANIRIMTESADEEDLQLNADSRKEYNDYINLGTDIQCESIANAPDLTSDEIAFFELRKMEAERGGVVSRLPELQELSYIKYQLQEYYGIDSQYINGAFVKKYSKHSVKSRFRELRAILACADLQDSLRNINIKDRGRQRRARDLNDVCKLNYDIHEFCVKFMKLSGLTAFPTDLEGIRVKPEKIMEAISSEDYGTFIKSIDHCCVVMSRRREQLPIIKPTTRLSIYIVIKAAARIVGTFYGLTWMGERATGNLIIKFKAKKEFDIGKERSATPSLPYIKLA